MLYTPLEFLKFNVRGQHQASSQPDGQQSARRRTDEDRAAAEGSDRGDRPRASTIIARAVDAFHSIITFPA